MRRLGWWLHPARVAPGAYVLGWLVGSLVLMLPVASEDGTWTGWWEASFTSMSALCITGLAVVDTPTHWSFFGEAAILVLIHVGGFGIMMLASLILFRVSGRPRVSDLLIAGTEARTRGFEGLRGMPARILAMMLVSEAVIAVVLAVRFRSYTDDWGTAVWQGVFHAVSSYNNAGFSLYSSNLIGFNDDPWIMLPICVAIMAGGLGFPVYLELLSRRRGTRRRFWSVHLRLTLIGTAMLLVAGFVTFAAFEWANPATLGAQPWSGKVLGAIGGTVFPRTAGFNSIDYALATDQTLAVNYGLMMIGGGSGGTAGGLKITTVAVLILGVLTEVAGEEKTLFAHRKISSAVQRQALAVVVLSVAAVFTGILLVSSVSHAPLREVTFEVISAFGTVGLSMNLTPTLPHEAWAVLMALMYLGRVGPVSVAAALALRQQHRRYYLPKEDPFVG